MAHATVSDVATFLLRPLRPDEEAAALAYLDLVEIILMREIDGFTERLADAAFSKAVVYVEATVTANVLRNPDRLQYEQAGDYSYSLQRVAGSDSLASAITDDMWRLLGVSRSGVFVVETATWETDPRAPRWWSTVDRW